MSRIPEIRMHERCETCAFRAGTRANADPITQHKVRLCIQTGTPFLCHEADREAWCAGVIDAMEALHGKGKFLQSHDWKQEVMRRLLDAIDRCEDVDKAGGVLTDEVVDRIMRESLSPAAPGRKEAPHA